MVKFSDDDIDFIVSCLDSRFEALKAMQDLHYVRDIEVLNDVEYTKQVIAILRFKVRELKKCQKCDNKKCEECENEDIRKFYCKKQK